jgi:hypothetical protein
MPQTLGRLIPPALSTPPSSPSPGEIYYDTDDQNVYQWDPTAAAWQDLSAVPGAGVLAGFGIDVSGSTASVDLNEHKVGPVQVATDYGIGTSYGDVTSLTLTLPNVGTYLIHAVCHINFVSGSPGLTKFRLMVDGVAQTGEVHTTHAVGRITMSRDWIVTTSGVSKVAKIQAFKTTGSSTVDVKAADSEMFAIQIA